MSQAVQRAIPIRPEVKCSCNTVVFDGLVVKARVIRVLLDRCQAKCKRCRAWVDVPLIYAKTNA